MLAWDNGRVDVVAETTAGPGYHRFVGRVLERLGFEQSISWSRDDPLNVTFGERPIVEQAYLTWLGPRLVKAHKSATAGRPAPQLGLPEGTRYTLKVRSPRPWVPGTSPPQGGHCRSPRRRRRHPVVGRRDRRTLPAEPGALPDVARRPLARPAVQGEAELIDEVHRLLSKASRSNPASPTRGTPGASWRGSEASTTTWQGR